jgi:Family of unknown function (DUF6521)
MTPWTERPIELANLLNPAFCGFLIRSAAASYKESKPEGMPFALAFLVLPLVLHVSTRKTLPRSVRTTLISWLRVSVQVGWALRIAECSAKLFEPAISDVIHDDQRRPTCRVSQVKPANLSNTRMFRRVCLRLDARRSGSTADPAEVSVQMIVGVPRPGRIGEEESLDINHQRGFLEHLPANAAFSGFFHLAPATGW